MKVKLEETGGQCLVAIPLSESIDVSNVIEFKEAMKPVVQRSLNLVIDLSPVRFMDSAGLGAVLSCLKRVREKKGSFRISGVSENVLALFQLVRLPQIVEIFETKEEAIRGIPGS